MNCVSPQKHQHSRSLLETELLKYLPDLDDNEAKILRNPFSGNICVENLPKTMQDEFLEPRKD